MDAAYGEHRWDEVARLGAELTGLDPVRLDTRFEYGMALAHLGRWKESHAALLAGARACPGEQRFAVELAGVAFEQKQHAEAARWLRKGLKIDPKDAYANNFLGTDYYLMGNLGAALKYWNRVEKPYIGALQFDPHLEVRRLLLDRSFAFSPAAVMTEAQFEDTEARLHGLGIFPSYNVGLQARPDGHFDAQFAAREMDGFGPSKVQALVSTFSGVFYETVYPRYFNIGQEAMNFNSLARWDAQKRRVWASLSAPIRELPQWRWQAMTDERDENWAIRQYAAGPSPVLGSLNLRREEVAVSLTNFASARLRWTLGADVSHRTFHDVVYGTALTPEWTHPGYELKTVADAEWKAWEIPEQRFTLTTDAHGEMGRAWNGERVFEKLEGSALAHWFPQAEGDRYEVQEQVRAGKLFGAAPFDELYLLGITRDTDLWMRGLMGTRDGRKGSSPIGNAYFLSNSDFLRRVYSNGLLRVQVGPLLDIGRMGAPVPGMSSQQWLFDTGVEARLTVLGTSVVLSYGRDLRSGNNAFFGTVAP